MVALSLALAPARVIPMELPLLGADGRPDLSALTREFFGDFEDPAVINTGWCFVWAWLAHLYTGARLYTVSTGPETLDPYTLRCWRPVHAFVRLGSRWYDAERPLGARGWRGLPSTENLRHGTRNHRTAVERSPLGFEQHFWFNGDAKWHDQGIAPWPRSVAMIAPVLADGAL